MTNPREIDFSRFIPPDDFTSTVRFRLKDGKSTTAMSLNAVDRMVDKMTGKEWKRLADALDQVGHALRPQSSAVKWNNWILHKTIRKVMFDGTLTVAFTQLEALAAPNMEAAAWNQLVDAVNAVSGSEGLGLTKRLPPWTNESVPGYEHPVFGTLVSGNKTEKLAHFSKVTITMEQVLVEINALYQAGAIDADDLQKLSLVPQPPAKVWDSSDALLLITEEIRHADNPRESASEWLSKFTSEVSTIIREADDGS